MIIGGWPKIRCPVPPNLLSLIIFFSLPYNLARLTLDMFHATTRALVPRVRCYATRANLRPSRSTNALAVGAGLGLLLTAGGIVHNDAADWIPWKKSTPAPQDAAASHEKQDPNITPTSWDQQNQVNRGLNEPGLFLWGDNT